MRLFALVFAVYTLMLTGWRCGDVHEGHHSRVDMVEHHEHDEGVNDCSPLCVCQCCHIALDVPQYWSAALVFQDYLVQHCQLNEKQPDSPVYDQFIPPRIV